MSIKFDKIKPGMTVYDRHKERMGNTTMRSIGEWPCRVISVDAEKRTAEVSWNGNPARTWYEQDFRNVFDWSMHDEAVAEVESGVWGCVYRVTKKKSLPPRAGAGLEEKG